MPRPCRLLPAAALVLVAACGPADDPVGPESPGIPFSFERPARLPDPGEGIPAPAGEHPWTWTAADTSGTVIAAGTAVLAVPPPPGAGGAIWRFRPAPPLPARLRLCPADTLAWHPFSCILTDSTAWLAAVPRRPVASPCYPHLLALATDLTAPLTGGRVRHWPGPTIPVRPGAYLSGRVDLSDCLRRAVAVWNEGETVPWFAIDEEATWGVRLVQYPEAMLSPPMQIHLTRVDLHGNPLKMSILLGANYRDASDTLYVVRGLVHELAHALTLWGHTPDRGHILWGSAPPHPEHPLRG